MAWTYKEYLKKTKDFQEELCSDDLERTANVIENVGSCIIALIFGMLFGPSFLIYRFTKWLFDDNPKSVLIYAGWMYWLGQIVAPACAKKGVLVDLETTNPGNDEERSIYYCYNLPIASDAVGESILREVRNRIASTFRISVLEVNHIYDISITKGQLKICRKGETQPQA